MKLGFITISSWEDINNPGFVTDRPVIVSCCSAGLCNRILAHAMAAELAEACHAQLIVHWPVNGLLTYPHGVGAEFENMFSNPDFTILDQFHLLHLFNTSNEVRWINHDDPYPKDLPSKPGQILVVNSYGVNNGLDERVQAAKVDERIRSFEPWIRHKVVPRGGLGVHVRTGLGGGPELINKYLTAVDMMLPEFGHLFLSVDDQELAKIFTDKYGDKVALINKTKEGVRSLRGMNEALLDLYTLATCRRIIGREHSSFSRLAGVIGKVPVEYV